MERDPLSAEFAHWPRLELSFNIKLINATFGQFHCKVDMGT